MAYQTLKLSKKRKIFEKISIWKILYMGSYMESINSKPDLIHVFKLEKFENFWNFFIQSKFCDRDRSCEIQNNNVRKLNWWSKNFVHVLLMRKCE